MVAPFLPAVTDWIVPQDVSRGDPFTHFGQRAKERGVSSVPGDLLQWAVERCLAYGRDDLVERVFSLGDQTALYRIRLPEGLFYPVIASNGHAVTMFTVDMVRRIKARRKRDKRRTGSRLRPRAPKRACA